MVPRLARARAYETEPDVFAVSVNGGFPNADIAELGPSILVTAQGDMARHAAFAGELAHDMWQQRVYRLNQFHSVQQAAAICKAHPQSSAGPIIVADYADNPGGGAYGDSTALLEALLAADVLDACFAPIVDPETVALLQRHRPGDTVSIRLGGKTDARFGGGPLELSATLVSLSDGRYVGSGAMIGGLHRSWGPCAVVAVQGIEILVTTIRAQVLDLQQFEAFGIDPRSKRVVGLKSMQHFRAAFEPIASVVIVCDSGALCTMDFAAMPYTRIARPAFPIDTDIDLDAWMRANADGIYIPQPFPATAT
jgi:microcystin degradation protein MlrC